MFYANLWRNVPHVLTVSLENVLLDVKELQRGIELTRREYSMHGHNTMLKDFITHNESKLKKLQDDAKIAQVTLNNGEKPFSQRLSKYLITEAAFCFPIFKKGRL